MTANEDVDPVNRRTDDFFLSSFTDAARLMVVPPNEDGPPRRQQTDGGTESSNGPTIPPDADVEADIAVDPAIVINNATLLNESQVVVGTPILPWWHQRNGQMLIGVTALSILAIFATLIGLTIDSAAKKDDGGPVVPMGEMTRRTCPSDETAKDCGATLEIWMDVFGWSVLNFVVVTENLTLPPNRTERLIDTLSGPFNMADNYGCRISGWLVPPITSDEYFFKITADDEGELWLSADDNPSNKVMVAQTKTGNIQSGPISFVAGRSYYFEVGVMGTRNTWIYSFDSAHSCISQSVFHGSCACLKDSYDRANHL